MGFDNIKKLVHKGMVEGLDAVEGHIDFCEKGCPRGKHIVVHTRRHHP